MSIHLEIWKWVKSLPSWQRHLLKTLLVKSELSPDDYELALQVLLADHHMGPRPATRFDVIENDVPHDIQTNGIVKLRSVGDMSNVATVPSGHKLDFSDGLTVIYGDNASGKSSYAKVLKQACRAVDQTTRVYPNVFDPGSKAAGMDDGQATISLELPGGTEVTVRRQVNSPPESTLTQISIFDSACAQIYINEENQLAYIPEALRLFSRLSNAQTVLQSMLDEEIARLEAYHLDTSPFEPGTPVRMALDELSNNPDITAITVLANVQPADLVALQEMERQAATVTVTDPAIASKELRLKLEDARKLAGLMEDLAHTVADESLEPLKVADDRLAAVQKAHEVASAIAFDSEPLQGVGSTTWLALWEAARSYSKSQAYPEHEFPAVDMEDARCPLCMQRLTEEARHRFVRFEDYVKVHVGDALDKARVARDQLLQPVKMMEPSALGESTTAREISIKVEGFAPAFTAFVDSVEARQSWALRGCESHTWNERPPLLESPISVVQGWISSLNQSMVTVEGLVDAKAQEALHSRTRLLRSRIALKERLPAVVEHANRKKRRVQLQGVRSTLNTGSVTRELSELTEHAVTDDLWKSIQVELKALRCNFPVRLGKRGVRGKTHVRVALDAPVIPAKLSEVLSEGEQRALSLAFFLGEIRAADHHGAVILDDPVSSLDHLRRQYVADRLAQEAMNRQVIVFTHDISFLFDLYHSAEQYGVARKYITVTRSAKLAGFVVNDLPWYAANVKQRVGHLKNHAQQLKKLFRTATRDECQREVRAWMGNLRDTWERVVEERLFRETVVRFRKSVETNRLRKVVVTADQTSIIVEAMTRTSNWLHDQATALNRDLPSEDDLDSEISTLETFLSGLPV